MEGRHFDADQIKDLQRVSPVEGRHAAIGDEASGSVPAADLYCVVTAPLAAGANS